MGLQNSLLGQNSWISYQNDLNSIIKLDQKESTQSEL
jgi:hypothetical protein